MPVHRKRLPDSFVQRFLINIKSHKSCEAQRTGRQFCWKLASSRHYCLGQKCNLASCNVDQTQSFFSNSGSFRLPRVNGYQRLSLIYIGKLRPFCLGVVSLTTSCCYKNVLGRFANVLSYFTNISGAFRHWRFLSNISGVNVQNNQRDVKRSQKLLKKEMRRTPYQEHVTWSNFFSCM